MSDTSQNAFTAWWSQEVADKFNLDVDSVSQCYGSGDLYETDGNLRAMWKYGTAKGVNGTPVAWVNGVKLDSCPMTVDAWTDLLNDIYNSQYSVSAVERYIQN